MLADDPQLNCRIAGLADDSPPIYVFDRLLRIPTTAKLFQSDHPVTVFCSDAATQRRRDNLSALGASIVILPS